MLCFRPHYYLFYFFTFLFIHFFSFPSILPVRPVITVFVPFIFHYLHRSFFALFLYFPFLHSFLCSPASWVPTCIYFFHFFFSLFICIYCHFLLLYAFPVVSSCFSRDYQTRTSQCSANHAFFPSFHDLCGHSFGCTYYRKYMEYHWLIHETSNSTRCALRVKSNAELFQTLICRFSFEKEITVCGLKQKLVWLHCDLSVCQSD